MSSDNGNEGYMEFKDEQSSVGKPQGIALNFINKT